MAGLLTAAFSFPFTKPTSLPSRTSIVSPERITLKKVSVHYRDFCSGGRVVSVRAQVAAIAETQSKKDLVGLVIDKFTPNNPCIGQCLSNTKISGYASPVEINHIIITTGGKMPYREGQAIGVIPDGVDENGKPHGVNLYSAASSSRGDTGDGETISLCVARSFTTDPNGELVPGVTSNFLCDLKPGDKVRMTGPSGKTIIMPRDQNATIIMLATGTGIAPFRSFCWRMFFEKHYDYKFNGLAWLFYGVPTSSSKLYDDEFQKIKEMRPDNFRLDYAISREETNKKAGKMYVQDRLEQYAEQIWEYLKSDNTFVYVCGLKAMDAGVDALMAEVAAKHVDWSVCKEELIKAEQWSVEVY